MSVLKANVGLPDRFEIVRGEVVPLAPTGDVHGVVENRVGRVLGEQADDAGLGFAFTGEVGIVVEPNPRTVRGADAAFMLSDQLPPKRTSEGYLLTPPALVVEVLSPNDRASEVQGKVLEYLRAGVRVVWVADPASRTLTVHLPDGNSRTLTGDAVLWAPGVLENLSTPVRDLFKGLERLSPSSGEKP